jgi:thiosulfate dehydrogenase (quinone) large subunit
MSTKIQKVLLFLLRISLGGFMLYAGITKVMDPSWSAAGYLSSANHFKSFYAWLSQSGMISITNFANEWALTLLGVSLILGVFVRLSGVAGAVLMALYYLVLPFPHPDAHSLIVDQHIIFIWLLLYFSAVRAGRFWGIDAKLSRSMNRYLNMFS